MRSKALTCFIIVLLSGISWISTKDQFRKLFTSLRIKNVTLSLRSTKFGAPPHKASTYTALPAF